MCVHIITIDYKPLIAFKSKKKAYEWAKSYAPDGWSMYKVELL